MQTATRPFSAPAPVTPRPSARFPPQPPAAPIARSSVQSDAPRGSQNAGSPASSARVSRRAHAACDSASSAGRTHPARPSRRRARRARPRLCKKSNWASRRRAQGRAGATSRPPEQALESHQDARAGPRSNRLRAAGRPRLLVYEYARRVYQVRKAGVQYSLRTAFGPSTSECTSYYCTAASSGESGVALDCTGSTLALA